jgi:hypothetical protein
VVLGALVLCAALDLVGIVSDSSYGQLIQRVLDGRPVLMSEIQAADGRQTAIGWGQLALFLATGIVFVVWFEQAYENVARLGVGGLRWSRRWAAGAWFVPFLNFVRPKAIANDIWRGSDPALPANSVVPEGSVPWFLNVWWIGFLVSGIFSRISFQAYRSAATLSALNSATTVDLAGDAIDIVAAVFAIIVVVELTRRQRERAAVHLQRYELHEGPTIAELQEQGGGTRECLNCGAYGPEEATTCHKCRRPLPLSQLP